MQNNTNTRFQDNKEKVLLNLALTSFEAITAMQAAILDLEVRLPEGIADAEIQLGIIHLFGR